MDRPREAEIGPHEAEVDSTPTHFLRAENNVAASLEVSDATLCRALADSVLPEVGRIVGCMRKPMRRPTSRASEALDEAPLAIKGPDERIDKMESGELPIAMGKCDSDGVAWNGMLGQGETVLSEWVRTGLLLPSSELATACGCSEQALDQATEAGELFDLQVGKTRYYPAAFMRLEMEVVKAVCSQLKGDDVVAKFIF